MSSSEQAVPDSHKKPPEKQKPGPPIQTPNADQPEAPSKDTKQKAEKRKAEPGTVTNDAWSKKKSQPFWRAAVL